MSNRYDCFTGKLEHHAFAATASGTNTILAAPATGKKRIVHGYRGSAAGAVDAQFAAGTTSSTLSGTFHMASKAQIGEPIGPFPVFTLAASEALLLDLSGATTVSGYIKYRELDVH